MTRTRLRFSLRGTGESGKADKTLGMMGAWGGSKSAISRESHNDEGRSEICTMAGVALRFMEKMCIQFRNFVFLITTFCQF
jgi:hypothetical protein